MINFLKDAETDRIVGGVEAKLLLGFNNFHFSSPLGKRPLGFGRAINSNTIRSSLGSYYLLGID